MTALTENWNKDKQRESDKKYRESHKEEIAAKNRKWRLAHPDKAREYTQRWKANNPQKVKARYAVRDDIRSGAITRPSVCSVCGEEGVKPDGHHPNYDDAHSVIWVCRKYHRAMRSDNGQN